MFSLKTIALSSLLAISVNAFASDANTSPVDNVVLDSLMACKINYMQNAIDSDKYFDCLSKSLSTLADYKDQVKTIRDLQDVLYAENNVLVAYEQAKEPNVRNIRTQSLVVVQLKRKIENLKIDLLLKMSDDEALKSFFNQELANTEDKPLVVEKEQVKAKRLIKAQKIEDKVVTQEASKTPIEEIKNQASPIVIESIEDTTK